MAVLRRLFGKPNSKNAFGSNIKRLLSAQFAEIIKHKQKIENKFLPLYIFYTFAPPKGTEFSAVGSALRSGRRGRWFESSNSDKLDHQVGLFLFI